MSSLTYESHRCTRTSKVRSAPGELPVAVYGTRANVHRSVNCHPICIASVKGIPRSPTRKARLRRCRLKKSLTTSKRLHKTGVSLFLINDHEIIADIISDEQKLSVRSSCAEYEM